MMMMMMKKKETTKTKTKKKKKDRPTTADDNDGVDEAGRMTPEMTMGLTTTMRMTVDGNNNFSLSSSSLILLCDGNSKRFVQACDPACQAGLFPRCGVRKDSLLLLHDGG